MPKRSRGGFVLFGVGLLIILSWIVYALWSAPRSTGLEIKDSAVFSVVPLGLGAALIVWGLVLVARALRSSPRR